MKIQAFLVAFAGLLLCASSYAMELDVSTPGKAAVELEKAFNLCRENRQLLDRLILDKNRTVQYNDKKDALADIQKLEENYIQVRQIALAIEKCQAQWANINQMMSELGESMDFQNDLLGKLK